MKKVSILFAVLSISSVAGGHTVWFEVDSADVNDIYEYSEVITINMVSDYEVLTMMVDAISNDNGGTAMEPLYLDDKLILTRSVGQIVNGGDPYILVQYISGSVPLGMPGVPAGEPIFSFEFHMPDVPRSTYITIDDYKDPQAQPPIATYFLFGDYTSGDDIQPMVFHFIPEPTMIALLGLGGMILLRRRK